MDLKLKVLEGKNAGKEIPVHSKKFLIGRAEDCNLRPGSELISRHHCVLLVEDGYLGVRDFGSKNGTWINGRRISSAEVVWVQPMDQIKFGNISTFTCMPGVLRGVLRTMRAEAELGG